MREGAWLVVSALSSAIYYGGSRLKTIPEALKRVIREELWREFVTPRGERVTHERFEDFLSAEGTHGLGISYEDLHRLVRDDPEARDLLDQAMQRKPGRPSPTVANSNDKRPTGTTSDQALRRLRKDRPDLHAKVIAGDLSAHAAMVEAGFRPRTCTVRLDDPARIAETLRKKLDHDQVDDLVRHLQQEAQ